MTGRASFGLAGALLLSAAALLAFSPEASEDTFWHLKAGQVMLAEHRLLRTNVFSALFPDRPWLNFEWLFQMLLAGTHAAVGWEGITVVKTLLACLLGSLLFGYLVKRSPYPATAALLAMGVLALARFRLVARPHLVSYVLFLVVVILVDGHFRSGNRRLWALPPLFAIWANLHPEFLLGLALIGSVAAGRWLDARRARDGTARIRALLVILLLCVLATLANPFGISVYLRPLGVVFRDPLVNIHEFAWSHPTRAPGFWAALVVTAIMAFSRRERRWADLLPVAWTAALALLYIRAIPYFLFVAAILVHVQLTSIRHSGRWSVFLRRVLPGVLAALALGWAYRTGRAAGKDLGWGLDERGYPAAAADALLSRPFPKHLYNTYDDGGYLIWRLYPVMKVFLDGGTTYPEDFLTRVSSTGPMDWARLFDDYGVNTVLAPRGGLELHVSRDDWAIVFWDQGWVILERRAVVTPEHLRQYEYQVFLPGVMPADVTDSGSLSVLEAEMGRNQRERRFPNAALANARGEVLVRLGREAEAAAAFREAVGIDSRLVAAWRNLGRTLTALGDPAGAAAALGEARRQAPP